MNVSSVIRRSVITGTGAVVAVALGTAGASAHNCYVPMYSLNGPVSSTWMVVSAEDGAAMFGMFEAECAEQVEAGYAALRALGLPVGVKVKMNKTIGDPKDEGRMPSQRGADGHGLEYFDAGSTLADRMLETWATAASKEACPE